MSKTNFTPGPWVAKRTRTLHDEGVTIDNDHSINAPHNKVPWYGLATVITSTEDGDRDDEGLANAHLIAAAPDMYEALDNALKWFHDPEVDRLEEWERIAHEFYKETGYLRPGKSWPMGEAVPDDVEDVWSDWCNRRSVETLNAMRLALAKARGEQQ